MKLRRAGDRPLQLLVFNEEFLVSASHQLALITSLPFVHTARRYYRLNGLVRPSACARSAGARKVGQTWSFRGSTSRNKVSVGEPAEGSLTREILVLGASQCQVCAWQVGLWACGTCTVCGASRRQYASRVHGHADHAHTHVSVHL